MRWLLADAILPMLVPVATLALGNAFWADRIDVLGSANKLLYEGFYIFSSMALVFSLFEDYSTFQKAISPVLAMFLMAPMFATCLIFYESQKHDSYFVTHLWLFFGTWMSLLIYATYIKIKMIKFKQKYQY